MLNQSYFHTMKFYLGDNDLGDLGLEDFSLRDLVLGDFNLGDFDLIPCIGSCRPAEHLFCESVIHP